MQVNNIQSSPNFGMALKINPEARRALEEKSSEELNRIGKLGKELAEHRHVNIVLKEGAKPIIKYRDYLNAYKDFFRPQIPTDRYLKVNTVWAELPHSDYRPAVEWCDLGSKKAAMNAYTKMKNANGEFESAVEFAKVIEKSLSLHLAEKEKIHERLKIKKV